MATPPDAPADAGPVRSVAPVDAAPDALGIMHCLGMLAEEASGLRLFGVVAAIRMAIETCRVECPGDDHGALCH